MMMSDYYLWENEKSEGDAFIYGGWPQDLPVSFYTGNRIVDAVPKIVITMNARSQGRLTDDLLLTGRGRVFSKKLLEVLRASGVDNIDTYPCTIQNTVTGESNEDYSVVNVIGKISCVDQAQSDLVFATGSTEDILGYDTIVLDEKKIGGARMFLLAEMPVQIVVHRDVADAVKAAGLTGMEFISQDAD